MAHVNHTFRQCGYQDWAVERGAVHPKEKDSTWERQTESWKNTSRKVLVGLPYIKGLSEELRTLRAHRVDSFYKPSNIHSTSFCAPKRSIEEGGDQL